MESKVSFTFDDNDGDDGAVESKATEPKGAGYRRHTISSKPKPKDQPPPRKSSDFTREKFSPPEVMLDSLYSTVEKTKRYPAPKVPAPPPPYDGKALKDVPKKVDENRTVSPPGYEPIANAVDSPTRKPGGGVPPASRPPPSRPSRPPAGSYMQLLLMYSGTSK